MSQELHQRVKWTYPAIQFNDLPAEHEAAIAVKTAFPDEVPSLEQMGLDRASIGLAKKLRTTLDNGFRFGDDSDNNKADTLCRSLGVLIAERIGVNINVDPSFEFGYNTIGFDGILVASPEPKMVIDHGVGLNGVLSHQGHLFKNPDHLVVASAIDDIQASTIEGVAQGMSYPKDTVIAFPGADETAEIMLEQYGENSFDIVLMSRIHSMGKQALDVVLETTPLLLKPGGMVIVRSPERVSKGMSAAQQADALLANSALTLDRHYNFTAESGDSSPQQAFILRKV